MASVASASVANAGAERAPPRSTVVEVVAAAGVVAGGISFTLALHSDEVAGQLGEPLVVAMLSVLLTLSYILCGLVAWWRRPASRFGPLMIAAGFTTFFTSLVWAHHAVPSTLGQALDLVPPVLFLHVFLAFPDGRVRERSVRLLLVVAYTTAIGLELVRMYFGEFGSRNLLEHELKGAADADQRLLPARHRSARRPQTARR